MGWCILLGLLAAYGGLCLIWALFGWLLPAGESGVTVIPGSPGESEPAFVRRYLWLREMGLMRSRLLVADLGLEHGQRRWLEQHGIEICSPEALPAGLGIGAEKTDGTGNGDSAGNHRRGGLPEL